jgi:kynurenine formamidase
MLIRISHPLETRSPLYPGTPPPTIIPFHSFEKDHASSTSLVRFHTHSGTHIDAPLHFCPGGKGVADLLGAGKTYSPAEVLRLAKTEDQCITPEEIEPHVPSLEGAHALLLITGEGARRWWDPAGYSESHPWIHPKVPELLRRHLPGLQIFGTDTISISSPAHREEGRACHRAFLCGTPPVLVLEDLDLSDPRLGGGGFRLHVCPWFNEALDGIPVVALMERA